MEERTLNAEKRGLAKKSEAQMLRKSGRIPAVVYGRGDVLHVSVEEKEFSKKFAKLSENTIITLLLEGKKVDVLVKDFQDDILSNKVTHVDFYQIERGKLLRTKIPVHVEGNAKGVREGGILDISLHELEVECLPKDIPESIVVNVEKLEMGEVIHVGDLKVADGIKILDHADQTVVSVVTLKTETVQEEEGEEEAGEA